MMWSLVLADGFSLSFNNGLPGQCPESWQFDNIPVFLVQLHKGFGHQCLWALTVAEYRPVHRWEKGNLTPRLFPSNKEVHQWSRNTVPSALTKECRVHTCINAANKGVDANALLLDIDSCRAQCTLVRLSATIYLIHILFSCNSTIDTYQQMTLSIQEVKFWLSSDQVLNLTESHLQFSGRQSIVG